MCFKIFIYLILTALGLCCCLGFSQVAVNRDSSLVVVHGLLIAVTSLIAVHGCNSWGARAQLPHGMWNLPGPEIKPMSPALAGRFLTSGPAGKS